MNLVLSIIGIILGVFGIILAYNGIRLTERLHQESTQNNLLNLLEGAVVDVEYNTNRKYMNEFFERSPRLMFYWPRLNYMGIYNLYQNLSLFENLRDYRELSKNVQNVFRRIQVFNRSLDYWNNPFVEDKFRKEIENFDEFASTPLQEVYKSRIYDHLIELKIAIIKVKGEIKTS